MIYNYQKEHVGTWHLVDVSMGCQRPLDPLVDFDGRKMLKTDPPKKDTAISWGK